jgi:AcrR family transcriptional regulator
MTSSPIRIVARQQRSRRTERALLDAAIDLFRTRGVEAVTVAEIAAAAQLAPATIYRRFGDKEGLLRAAFARFVAEALKVVEQAPIPKSKRPFTAVATEMVVFVLRFSQANQTILQSAYARALVDDFYTGELILLRTRVFDFLTTLSLAHGDEIRHPQPELAVNFVLRQSMAMLSARIEAHRLEVGGGMADDRVFLCELLRSILAYLGVPFNMRSINASLSANGF